MAGTGIQQCCVPVFFLVLSIVIVGLLVFNFIIYFVMVFLIDFLVNGKLKGALKTKRSDRNMYLTLLRTGNFISVGWKGVVMPSLLVPISYKDFNF